MFSWNSDHRVGDIRALSFVEAHYTLAWRCDVPVNDTGNIVLRERFELTAFRLNFWMSFAFVFKSDEDVTAPVICQSDYFLGESRLLII